MQIDRENVRLDSASPNVLGTNNTPGLHRCRSVVSPTIKSRIAPDQPPRMQRVHVARTFCRPSQPTVKVWVGLGYAELSSSDLDLRTCPVNSPNFINLGACLHLDRYCCFPLVVTHYTIPPSWRRDCSTTRQVDTLKYIRFAHSEVKQLLTALTGITRGYRSQLLTSQQYGNLTQCETVDGVPSRKLRRELKAC